MARWAVFDVDGTLLPRISMEKEFLNYLLKKKLLPFKNLTYCLFKALTTALAHGWEEAIKSNKTYLKGLSTATIEKYADKCFRQHIALVLAQTGKQKIEVLRQEGHNILIISGSLAFLVRHLEPVYHPNFIISTELEINNGYYSGNISGVHPYGRRKRIILENLQKELDIDFDKSVVFADHHSDVHHMKLFGKAVAVNATSKLRNAALKYGWELDFWT